VPANRKGGGGKKKKKTLVHGSGIGKEEALSFLSRGGKEKKKAADLWGTRNASLMGAEGEKRVASCHLAALAVTAGNSKEKKREEERLRCSESKRGRSS